MIKKMVMEFKKIKMENGNIFENFKMIENKVEVNLHGKMAFIMKVIFMIVKLKDRELWCDGKKLLVNLKII